jgi:metallo-beta-lactamase class B
MKKSLITAAFVLVAIPAFAQQNATWTAPFEPFKVIDNVYYVGSAGLSSWLITGSAGDILLDVGVPANAAMVENNIKKLGFKLSDIRVILVSHAHFDHAGGVQKLKDDTGASLIASEGERYALENGVYPGSEQNTGLNFPKTKIDLVLGDPGRINLGDITMTSMATPGHTKGCTSYLLPVKDEQGKPHTAFFFCSATIAANRLAPNPQYPGIIDDYRKTFAKVKTVKADIYLAPHAEFYDMPGKRARMAPGQPNPFIVPGEVQTAIAKFETDFNLGLAKQEAAAKAKPAT